MNKKEKKQNNKLIIYFIIIIGIILFLNFVIRFFFFPNIPIKISSYQSVNKDGTSSIFLDVKYSGSKITIPKKLSIAVSETVKTRPSKITDLIKDTLKLLPKENIENIWENNQWYLNFQEHQNRYILLDKLKGDVIKEEPTSIGFNEKSLIEFANQQRRQFLPNLDISIQRDAIVYWPNEHEYTNATTIDKATIVVIPFAFTIDSYPISYEKETDPPFEFTIENDLSFRKMVYFPHIIKPKIIGTKNSITIEEALINIKERNISSIISFYQEKGTPLKIERIKSADFKSVSIEYRIDNSQNLIYPFFKFKGTAVTENDLLKVEVITPAIDLDF